MDEGHGLPIESVKRVRPAVPIAPLGTINLSMCGMRSGFASAGRLNFLVEAAGFERYDWRCYQMSILRSVVAKVCTKSL